ncbi:MAG: signal peptidase I [Nitrospinaceae bacterium]|jgi:signal peptidase I|nr:signal peptidase I [Nitrospinaceae bacterium]MBT3433990.1 signal peptidase I [Nitrospinaceae bacterium]MBT4094864.1 signal peptidase I [Nitrospinaceae bacterium]MBT4431953.1 signal peptidase I [Nitrospinaceae bacterium]MBT5369449.1 signal peptidase I [Nitrospinaceae bacterium]
MSDSTAASDDQTNYKRKEKSTFREYAEAILVALALALFVRSFVVQAFKIPSGSMEETLLVGDHILVSKFSYWFRDVARGDVVVFRFPRDERRDFIKRVIGLPGDVVLVRGKRVYVNCKTPELIGRCQSLKEPYAVFKNPDGVAAGPPSEKLPYRVPAGSYLVMGDNRNNSQDSRYWGFLKSGVQLDHMRLRFSDYSWDIPFPCGLWKAACWDSKIRGNAFLIYWSWNSPAGSVRWSRLGSWIK